MEALGEAVSNALLQPWRAVASGSGEEEGTEGGERLYLRALALHASERTLRALLSRDGELLDAFASELWKAMRRLVEEGDEAILDAILLRTSTRGGRRKRQERSGFMRGIRLICCRRKPASRRLSAVEEPTTIASGGNTSRSRRIRTSTTTIAL